MKKAIALAVLALGVTAFQINAQPSPGRVLRRIRPDPNAPTAVAPADPAPEAPKVVPRVPLVSALAKALDTNHNGMIEAAEIENAPQALKSLDANGDGKLTADEYLGKGESPLSPMVKVLDVNGDGVISEKEIAGAASSLRMLDKNGDGRLTPSEFKPIAAPVVAATPAAPDATPAAATPKRTSAGASGDSSVVPDATENMKYR